MDFQNKFSFRYFVVTLLFAIGVLFSALLTSCGSNKHQKMTFALSADYPPFEYYERGELTGFDVDLARMVAEKMGRTAVFEDMQFSTIFAAVQNGSVDAAISTISASDSRMKNLSFSQPYHVESIAMIFMDDKPVVDKNQLDGKKIACQLGTTMEMWVKKHYPKADIIVMDNSNQTIEALKSGHADVVITDGPQGVSFSKQYGNMSYVIIGQSDRGYSIVYKNGSELENGINDAISEFTKNGKLAELKKKWKLDVIVASDNVGAKDANGMMIMEQNVQTGVGSEKQEIENVKAVEAGMEAGIAQKEKTTDEMAQDDKKTTKVVQDKTVQKKGDVDARSDVIQKEDMNTISNSNSNGSNDTGNNVSNNVNDNVSNNVNDNVNDNVSNNVSKDKKEQ